MLMNKSKLIDHGKKLEKKNWQLIQTGLETVRLEL